MYTNEFKLYIKVLFGDLFGGDNNTVLQEQCLRVLCFSFAGNKAKKLTYLFGLTILLLENLACLRCYSH